MKQLDHVLNYLKTEKISVHKHHFLKPKATQFRIVYGLREVHEKVSGLFPTSKTHSICFTKHEHMNLSNFLSQFCVVLRVTLIRLDFLKISPERGRFNLHSFMFHEELIQYQYIFLRHNRKVGHETQDAYRWDSGTQNAEPQNV